MTSNTFSMNQYSMPPRQSSFLFINNKFMKNKYYSSRAATTLLCRMSLIVILLFAVIIGYGQTITTGDFRTIGTATFSSPTNWQTYDGSNWVNATTSPANAATATATATVDTQFYVKSTIGAIVTSIPNVTTTASTTITVPSTALLVKGQYVSGPFIPGNATISSITNSTQFVLSAAALAGTGTLTFSVPNKITGVTWAANASKITFNAANIIGTPVAGQPISGGNIPVNAFIYSVTINGANSTLQIATNTTTPVATMIANASTNATLSFGSQLGNNTILELQTAPYPIYVGMPLNGPGLGVGNYYVTNINVNGNSNCIQMSAAPSSSRPSNFLIIGGLQMSISTYLGAVNSGTIAVGNLVVGTGIPAGTTVTYVSGNRITFSQPANAQAFTLIPPASLSFYPANTSIANVFINHNTIVDASNTALINNLYVNNALSSNAGTGAAYSNANLTIGNSTNSKSLFLGNLTVATNASIAIGAFNAKHSISLNGTGNTINNSGTISLYNNTSQYGSIYFIATGTSSLNGTGTYSLNDLTISNGDTLVAPSAMTLYSNFVNNGAFIHNGSTLTCAGGTTTVSGLPTTFNAITINAKATFTCSVNTSIAGNVINNGGTFTNSNSTFIFSGNTSLTSTSGTPTFSLNSVSITGSLTAYSGVMSISGTLTNKGTFIHNNGTVNLTASGGNSIGGTGFSTVTSPFYNVNFTGNNTYTLNNSISVANNLTINAGETVILGDTIKVGGNLTNNGNFTAGTFEFSGNTTISGTTAIAFTNVIIDATATLIVPANATISVIGDWTNKGGTFTANQSTVILSSSGNQSLIGATTFYNLQKQATSACTLTLQSGIANAQTISGTLTINGTSASAVLTIASDNQGTQAFIKPTSVGAVSYVNVSDNNTSFPISATQSSNGGDNIGWTFSGNIALHGSAVYSFQDPISLVTPIETSIKNDLSPVNQVFQWAVKEDSNQTAYLWIPENCKSIRGLLVLGWNIPEHMFVGHSAIRKACADNGLGIVLSSDFYFNLHSNSTRLDCLQRQLKILADSSGYPEITTAPLLPIGESGHLLIVQLIMDSLYNRCIAGACMKNPFFPGTPNGKLIPMINSIGTGYEWSQTDTSGDPRTNWNTGLANSYQTCAGATKGASILIEAGTGHFECSERMTQFLARYIGLAAKARLKNDTSQTLIPNDLTKGYLANLPVPGITNLSIIPYNKATSMQKASMAWYFDSLSAKEAQAIANVNWSAQTQIPSVAAGDNDSVSAFSFNSVTQIYAVTNSEFSLKPYLLDTIPSVFQKPGVAGSPLAKSPGKPYLDWICGNVQPLGNNRFKVQLSRYGGVNTLIVKADSSKGIRYSNQPVYVNFVKNNSGTAQTITFSQIANLKDTAKSIPLVAKSNRGLPVSFYVESGPGIVKENKLVFTKIPPSAKYPIAVTVVAWQWGTCTAPLYKQATVKQTFYITK